MSRDAVEITDGYEERIAALEARLRAFEAQVEAQGAANGTPSWKDRIEKYGLLVAWAVLIAALAMLVPSLAAWNPYAVMFGTQAMIIALTLALLLPLTAGDFDLSVASIMALSAMLIALLNVRLGFHIVPSVLIALLAGALVGAVNAFFILYFRIHSLIVTLGIGYFINGVILWISNSAIISGVSMGLVKSVILTKFLGVPAAFWYVLILAAIIWYLFEHTTVGRQILFTGRGSEVARLSGVNTNRIRAGCLIASGVVAAFAGVLYTGMRGSADPSSALSFLLPAFAAAFLGSTTIMPGRFNAFGSLIAVLFLSTGIMGLNFLGADTFVQNLFYGGGLVIAVSISQLIRKRVPMD